VTRRARIARVTVQLDVLVDDTDTDTLTPLPVQPISCTTTDWPAFNLDTVTKAIQGELDGQDPGGGDGPVAGTTNHGER
jgi:hypothetical protein